MGEVTVAAGAGLHRMQPCAVYSALPPLCSHSTLAPIRAPSEHFAADQGAHHFRVAIQFARKVLAEIVPRSAGPRHGARAHLPRRCTAADDSSAWCSSHLRMDAGPLSPIQATSPQAGPGPGDAGDAEAFARPITSASPSPICCWEEKLGPTKRCIQTSFDYGFGTEQRAGRGDSLNPRALPSHGPPAKPRARPGVFC